MARGSSGIWIALVAVAGSAMAQDAPRLALRMSPQLNSDVVEGAPSSAARAAPATLTPVAVVPAQVPVDTASRTGLGDYRIGPEDLVEIQVFGVDQLARTVRVNSFGSVSLPLIGATQVGGMTATEAERFIARKLAENYLQDPQVSVFIKEYTNQRVTVEGAVVKPGIYPLRGQSTLLRTLAIAGGQGGLSDMKNVVIFRVDGSGQRQGTTFDVESIRHGEADDPVVMNDDVIVVNRSPGRVVLKDSIFRDALDAVNPFSYLPK